MPLHPCAQRERDGSMKAERMLTRKEFAEKHNIRSVATIDRWLQHQYLPGAHIDPETREWKIPEESLPPYTRARACKEESILASILRATQQEKSVFASMYHISEERFQQYIQALLEAKCLKRCKVFHGVPQYIITPEGEKYLAATGAKKRENWQFLCKILESLLLAMNTLLPAC